MAYIDDEENKQQGEMGSQPMAGASGSFAGGATQGAQGAGAAAQGTGGRKQWINIQDYLGANPNGSQSDKYLDKEVGSKVRDESNTFNTNANTYENNLDQGFNTYKPKAQAQLGNLTSQNALFPQMNIASSTAQPVTNPTYGAGGKIDLSRMGVPGGVGASGPGPLGQQLVGLRDAQAGIGYNPYSAPTAFSGGPSAALDDTAGKLGDPKQFQDTMAGIYQKNLPSFTTGQRALQGNLDLANPNLDPTRQRISNDYNTFKTNSATRVGDLNTKGSGYATEAGKLDSDVGMQDRINKNYAPNLTEIMRYLQGGS